MQRRDLLKAASAASLGWLMHPMTGWAAPPTKPKILYFTRSAGFEHSAVRREGDQLSHSEKVLSEMGKSVGIEVECTKDGGVFDGDLDQYAAIAFYTSGDLTKPNQRNTPPMTAEGKQKLLDAIAAGKGFVGFHAATDTFHSKGPRGENQSELDPYIAMIGGEFVTHGPQQKASIKVTSQFHGLTDMERFSLLEEWYALKNFAPDMHVILVQETEGMKGDCYQRPNFPCTWARLHGKGRVFQTSLGHREDVWTNPIFQALTVGAFAWVMGMADHDVKPNLKEAAPNADQMKA